MNSIEEKIKILENLNELAKSLQEKLKKSNVLISGQITEMESSGKWADSNCKAFKSKYLQNYLASSDELIKSCSRISTFLINKSETLKQHKNSL